MLVGDYIRHQLSTRESVNFPSKGGGFLTYANCILDPDRNRSQNQFENTSNFSSNDVKNYQHE